MDSCVVFENSQGDDCRVSSWFFTYECKSFWNWSESDVELSEFQGTNMMIFVTLNKVGLCFKRFLIHAVGGNQVSYNLL